MRKTNTMIAYKIFFDGPFYLHLPLLAGLCVMAGKFGASDEMSNI
jgi:hypothetical protein